jgi:hypothetical protein
MSDRRTPQTWAFVLALIVTLALFSSVTSIAAPDHADTARIDVG